MKGRKVSLLTTRLNGFIVIAANLNPHMFTFNSQRKCMTLVQCFASSYKAFSKGAPEVIIARCSHLMMADGKVVPMSPPLRDAALAAVHDMAQGSLRVIALAHKDGNRSKKGWRVEERQEELETDMVLDGLFGIKETAFKFNNELGCLKENNICYCSYCNRITSVITLNLEKKQTFLT